MSVTVKINNSVWMWLKDYLDRHAVTYQVVGEPTKVVIKPTSPALNRGGVK